MTRNERPTEENMMAPTTGKVATEHLYTICATFEEKRDAGAFLKACRRLRFWDREAKINLDAKS